MILSTSIISTILNVILWKLWMLGLTFLVTSMAIMAPLQQWTATIFVNPGTCLNSALYDPVVPVPSCPPRQSPEPHIVPSEINGIHNTIAFFKSVNVCCTSRSWNTSGQWFYGHFTRFFTMCNSVKGPSHIQLLKIATAYDVWFSRYLPSNLILATDSALVHVFVIFFGAGYLVTIFWLRPSM